jgi:hypothetical protein
MKAIMRFFVSFFLMCLIPVLLTAQDISVHKFIGKSKSDVIKKYGNPVHQDNSNPDMMCMFYQSKTNRMIFVSNKDGVYQSEATTNYDTEANARSVFENILKNSRTESYAVDSISVNDFQIHKTGVKADVQMTENKITKNFDVSVKAHKTED